MLQKFTANYHHVLRSEETLSTISRAFIVTKCALIVFIVTLHGYFCPLLCRAHENIHALMNNIQHECEEIRFTPDEHFVLHLNEVLLLILLLLLLLKHNFLLFTTLQEHCRVYKDRFESPDDSIYYIGANT